MLTARLLLARCCCLDRCSGLGRCLLLILPFALADPLASQVRQSKDLVKFRLRDGYLILVQAKINGGGPFDFLLDTGTTRTVIDPELARQLQAPVIGEASLTGVLHVRRDELVRLEDLGLGEASLSGVGAAVDQLTRQKLLAPGIRGVLGEDFLSKFDILIDYKQHWLRFGGVPPAGDRCRFKTIGEYRGSPTTNRLLITTEFMEVSRTKVQLQLDTGARIPELFPSNHDSRSSQPCGGSMATSSDAKDTTIFSNVTLKIGATMIRHIDV